MRWLRGCGTFFLCLLLNLLMSLELTIPAWILLGLHFWLDWPIWYFWVALALWPVVVLIQMDLIGLLTRLGNHSDPPKENKNPYSVKKGDDSK